MPSLPTSSFLPPRRGKVKKDVKDRITAMSGSLSLHKSGRSCGMVLVSRRRGAIEGTFLVLSLLSLLLSLSPRFSMLAISYGFGRGTVIMAPNHANDFRPQP